MAVAVKRAFDAMVAASLSASVVVGRLNAAIKNIVDMNYELKEIGDVRAGRTACDYHAELKPIFRVPLRRTKAPCHVPANNRAVLPKPVIQPGLSNRAGVNLTTNRADSTANTAARSDNHACWMNKPGRLKTSPRSFCVTTATAVSHAGVTARGFAWLAVSRETPKTRTARPKVTTNLNVRQLPCYGFTVSAPAEPKSLQT